MSEVAVIIRTRNEEALIGRCLERVLEQELQLGRETIVVDSGSTDRTLAIVRSFAEVKVLEMAPAEFSYGRALNFGIRHAAPDTVWLAFLSAHAVPMDRNWLSRLLAPMLQDPGVAGVYGRQLPWPEHMQNRVVRHLSRHGYRECYGELSFVSRESPYFSNANAAIRHECWRAVPFDEDLPYAEDYRWSAEVRRRSWSIGYAADAAVWHSHAESAGQFLRRRRSEERGMIAIEAGSRPRQRWWHYARSLFGVVRRGGRSVLRGQYAAGIDALVTEGLIATAVYLERRRRVQATRTPA